MATRAQKRFVDLTEAEVADYALAADARLPIPPEYATAVIDSLRILQGHARLVVTALAGASPGLTDAAPGAFEP